MKLSKEQRISGHKTFCGSNWRMIAVFSWGQFLEKGKGAVVVPEDDILSQGAPELAPIRFNYVTKDFSRQEGMQGFFGEKEEAWLRDYDPDEKVIMMVIRNGGGISSYFIGGSPKPSKVYTEYQSASNYKK